MQHRELNDKMEVSTLIYVFSDFWFEGQANDIVFVKHQSFGKIVANSIRIAALIVSGEVVFLQHLAGDLTTGGPVPADIVRKNIEKFISTAKLAGITEEQVSKRLIVFAACPEQAEKEMPIIRLQDIQPNELEMTNLEIWAIGPEHPLNRIKKIGQMP